MIINSNTYDLPSSMTIEEVIQLDLPVRGAQLAEKLKPLTDEILKLEAENGELEEALTSIQAELDDADEVAKCLKDEVINLQNQLTAERLQNVVGY